MKKHIRFKATQNKAESDGYSNNSGEAIIANASRKASPTISNR